MALFLFTLLKQFFEKNCSSPIDFENLTDGTSSYRYIPRYLSIDDILDPQISLDSRFKFYGSEIINQEWNYSYTHALRKLAVSCDLFIIIIIKNCHWWTQQHVLFRSGCGRKLSRGARVGSASACRRCLPCPSPGASSGRSPACTP
jgi:hypothetical protein